MIGFGCYLIYLGALVWEPSPSCLPALGALPPSYANAVAYGYFHPPSAGAVDRPRHRREHHAASPHMKERCR